MHTNPMKTLFVVCILTITLSYGADDFKYDTLTQKEHKGTSKETRRSPIQDAIDNAKEGSIIKLTAGVYEGNIVITKPISIIGVEEGVILDGLDAGSVVTVKSSYVTLKNLTITNSGDRSDSDDRF